MTALTTDILESLRRRRSAGESVKAMAKELGLTWQKLDKAIRNGIRCRTTQKTTRTGGKAQEASQARLTPASRTGPLVERYRPRRLLDIVGQDEVVKQLCMFAARPFPTALLFEGETGTGKTTAAMALAAELGCDLSQKPPEFGGLHVIASGEQTADTIRDIHNQLWRSPFSGSGWKVLIVNEADRMHPAVETIWLDRLESLPPKTVIVFTTNYAGKLSARFRDRCTRMAFESRASRLGMAAYGLLADIWRRETGTNPDMTVVARIVEDAKDGDELSLRRAVQLLQRELAAQIGGLPSVALAKEGAV